MRVQVTFFISQGDVECCFYQFELPQSLKHFLGLSVIRGRFLPPAINKELARLDRQTLEALLEQEPLVASRCVKLFEQR